MDIFSIMNQLLLIMTGDDSKPWLVAICLIISIIVMIFLFVLGKGDGNDMNDKDRK